MELDINVRLWVDDIRPAPRGWERAIDYTEAVMFLRYYRPNHISLDHDLGEGLTGYDVAKYIVENNCWPQEIWLHSANPVGRWNMFQLLSHYAPPGVIVHK